MLTTNSTKTHGSPVICKTHDDDVSIATCRHVKNMYFHVSVFSCVLANCESDHNRARLCMTRQPTGEAWFQIDDTLHYAYGYAHKPLYNLDGEEC